MNPLVTQLKSDLLTAEVALQELLQRYTRKRSPGHCEKGAGRPTQKGAGHCRERDNRGERETTQLSLSLQWPLLYVGDLLLFRSDPAIFFEYSAGAAWRGIRR